ncbi:HEAT repeat-containing protein 1 [Anoplophora glabripennis]|nr:HEAT repeat-containing protein 1 [Anoplophora glabripennis]XP_018577692.1 HEAT repeat-containing protein 1 [Anoplophora glabripennis]
MSTSLAEQLQRLAVPQTTVLKRDKKRASLLFDPKEAAGLKRETVYQIGLEGLEELISKNEVFSQFKNSLFHITSRDFERSVHDDEANHKLDKTIRKFLVLLSPYFLLNCSHKALEWLINRYSINEYNREDLLMLILPYHESNIFVRLLQLLRFKDSRDSFYFLKALQKPGVHLPKQSLLQHAASDSSFLKFVTKYIKLLLKFHEKPSVLTVAFNFYCSVFAGAVEYSEKVTEDQVSHILPLIIKGLNSPVADFCAASYVVTARLVTKSSFSDKLLDKLVEKLCDIHVLGLKTEMCLVLIVLYQSQKQYNNVPVTAVASLSEKEWLPKTLQELNNSGSYILPLLEKLVKRCTEEGINNNLTIAHELIKNCLKHIKLEDADVANILLAILDSVKSRKRCSDEITSWLVELIQMLEKQYPNAFDQEIIKILSAIKDEKMLKRKKLLSKILKSTMAYKGKFDVFEKLYHPNPKIRGEAIGYLKQNYNSLRETNKEIIKQSLLDRLNDDDINIVRETFSVVHKISIFGIDELKGILTDLTKKIYKVKTTRKILSVFIINLLNAINDPKDWKVILAVFPFLLPRTEEDLLFSKKIIGSPCVSENILLKPFIEKLQNIKKEDDFVTTIFESLQSNGSWEIVKEFLVVLHEVPKEQRDTFYKYVACLVLTNILPNKSSTDVMYLVLDILVAYYETCEVKSFNKESNINYYMDLAAEEKFPIQGFLKCLECAIKKTDKQEFNLTFADFTEDCSAKKYFVLLANILISNQSKKTAAVFLNYFCEDWITQYNFMLNLCISGNRSFNSSFKLDALNYLIKLSKNIDVEEFKQFIYIDKPTTAYLLTLLADPSDEVRKLTVEIIESLLDASSRKSSSYLHLLEGLRKHKEEIIIDHEQISLIIFNILDPSNTKGKKHSSNLNSIRNHMIKLVGNEEIPNYLKASILNLLSHINTFEILEQICKVAIEILQEKVEVIDGSKMIIIKKIISRIEAKIANKISLNTNIWKFIINTIKNCKTVLKDEHENISPSVCILWQLDKDFFQELEEEVEKKLLDIIIEVSCVAENPEVLPVATRIFKHIDLDANLIMEQLTKMRDVQSPKTDTAKIKRRVSVVPTVDILDTLEWRKGVSLLEFIQDKKKIRNTNILLPTLFDILKKCLDFDEQTVVEYTKQLLLSSILHFCLKMNDEVLPENIFNMELVVQCIRASQNPQTHHHALLVLAHTAQLLPSQVLHHMMAIFTFMGSSVLRHDDAYSFQIITKIIDTIIPILVQDNQISTIAKVLRVFVDVLLDVPEHRRMPLYRQLLTRINVQENLYLFLLLVFESQVLHSNKEKPRNDSSSKRLDIAADLCREFAPSIVLSSCIKLIKHINELPDEKEDIMETDDSDTFNIITHSPKDFRHYKYLLLKFTSNLLASQEFVKQIAVLTDEEEMYLEDLYKEMIVNILQYIQRTSKVAEKAADTPQAQYWKVILHHSYDVLDSLNALVTPQMFLLVTKGLMAHGLNTVRRRILELLNNKLQHNAQFFMERGKTEIYTLIPSIISIVEGIDNEVDSEQEIIIQTALLSLKLLVKSLAPDDPEKFVQILDFITNVINSGKAKNNVLASVILCLAELCVTLKAHAISGLAEFMPAIIKILKQQKYEEAPSVLMRSVITTIEKIFISMPLFLSPYLEKLLVELSILISKWSDVPDDSKIQPFLNKLTSIKQKIGTIIPPRVLIPAVEECYNKLIEKKCFNAINALMDILAENLSTLKGSEINSNLTELTSFFLNALKFRSDGSFSLEDANVVEGHIVQALTVLILKLSENTFRPLYYKLYDWAVRNDVKNERVITFYNLSSGFAHSLKGLFVLFAGHFLNNAAQILDSCNETKNEELYFIEESKNTLLLEYTLKTLNEVFLHGSQRFINKDRFDILMQPLVDQLENTLGGVENLLKRNEELVTPCLIHFALATADDALWKQMNYQILLKMRHNVSKVRLIALHCLTEIVKKLGEDFLSLLPETIPFLAELLEDEEEEVEKACQRAVQEMEKVLGEPLQKYF